MRDWKQPATAYFATLVTVLVLDLAWIWLVAQHLFRNAVGGLLRPEPVLAAIVLFYVVYAAGVTMLAVLPALQQRSWQRAATLGAVLGLTAYCTFDLTNLALLNGWTVSLAAIDIAWGVGLSAVAAVVGYRAALRG